MFDDEAERPRVVHVFNTLNSGGLQRVVIALATWARQESQVESVLVSAGGPLEKEVASSALDWRRKHSRVGPLSEIVQLRRILREFRPHVIHAHQRHDALISHIASAGLGISVVEHAHNTLPDTRLRFLSFRSKRIFAVSEDVKRMVVQTFRRDPERVTVVGGVPFNSSDTPVIERVAPALDEPRLILGIGRLEEQKDPERFVRAIAEASKLANVAGRWLGAGSLDETCKKLASDLGSPVEFVGESRDVVGELDRAHGLLITSRWEGLGLVILEAFARRRPVVGIALGGMGELLGGGRGTIVDATATDRELASALLSGTEFDLSTEKKTSLALDYVEKRASPEAVYGPIVREYFDAVRKL
ncbi:hypothetical protein CBF90_14430 [Microbacterium sp. AISO3]|uniref:glycosyltransferase n=1 Tax=Micrococcales TaxID=85006 RepID=UPI000B4DB790|nr:glycosyltransferase [Microbacterium sp. AISO3]OWP20262.1 hypothetical protein CBF90_17965 [Microbacterium sp. AISO3]OWP20910.1 hypothetical protein CBF90_14430 [Microbacterium sp. AISO3]